MSLPDVSNLSTADLIDRILCLRTNHGKEPKIEDLEGLDKEALIRILEEEAMTLDTHFPWRNRKLLAFYN